jgi:hypothetical protein
LSYLHVHTLMNSMEWVACGSYNALKVRQQHSPLFADCPLSSARYTVSQ